MLDSLRNLNRLNKILKVTIRERYHKVLERLSEVMPNPTTELEYADAYQLLIAVILSAQCTDKRINTVTPPFFERFPNISSLAEGTEDEIFSYIRSVTYPNQKAKSLLKAARLLREEYGGEIPHNFDDLLRLPGVGRKTANVMLAVLWNEAAMPVDTHVFRVSNRIGLTNNSKTPLATERTLCKYIPSELLPKAHHWLILHGRYVCKARKPECDECVIADLCRYCQSSKYDKQKSLKR